MKHSSHLCEKDPINGMDVFIQVLYRKLSIKSLELPIDCGQHINLLDMESILPTLNFSHVISNIFAILYTTLCHLFQTIVWHEG